MRQATYRLLAMLFRYPSDELRASALALAVELEPESDAVRAFPFCSPWRGLLDALRDLGDEAGGRLEAEYLDLFLLRELCPLYEAAYLDGSGSGWAVVSAEVERAYAASGVALAPDANGELPDHVALQLEFLAHVCAEEALAWRDGLTALAVDCLERERAFLDRHLGHWLPLLAQRVGRVSGPTSFYRRLAEAADAFVDHDRDLIRALAEAQE